MAARACRSSVGGVFIITFKRIAFFPPPFLLLKDQRGGNLEQRQENELRSGQFLEKTDGKKGSLESIRNYQLLFELVMSLFDTVCLFKAYLYLCRIRKQN